MTEHDRDQEPIIGRADEPSRTRSRVTGLSDFLPDWLISPEGKQHLRNARKEMLLAARTVLDAAIERQEAGPAPRRAVSRVEID
jgi:hypothetical protein